MSYIKESNQFLKKKNIQNRIEELAQKYKDKKIMIYGAGKVLDLMIKNYNLNKLNIIGIVDKKFNNSNEYHSYKTYDPYSFMKETPDIVLIGIRKSEIAEDFFENELFPIFSKFKYESLVSEQLNEQLCEYMISEEIKEKYSTQSKIKVVLGSAGIPQEGWIITDKDDLNITKKHHWSRLFKENSIDNLLAEHVFEHLELEEVKDALEYACKYLKKGGVIRIAVPDGYHPSEYYRRMTKPEGEGSGAFDHKIFFTIDLLRQIIDQNKFKLVPIEYFDKEGIFHKNPYTVDDGPVLRTAENYPLKNSEERKKFYDSIPKHLKEQFEKNSYTYTSLLVDLIKN